MAGYVIVNLTEDDSTALVPKIWLDDDNRQCRWPPGRDVDQQIKTKAAPKPNWTTYDSEVIIEIDQNATYDEACKQFQRHEKQTIAEVEEQVNSRRLSMKRPHMIEDMNETYDRPAYGRSLDRNKKRKQSIEKVVIASEGSHDAASNKTADPDRSSGVEVLLDNIPILPYSSATSLDQLHKIQTALASIQSATDRFGKFEKAIADIQSEQAVLNMKVDQLIDAIRLGTINNMATDVILDDPSVVMPDLPVRDEVELSDLDDMLLADDALMDQMVKHLKRYEKIGTINTKCRSLLDHILDENLRTSCNWSGRSKDVNSKLTFKEKSGINRLIARCLRYGEMHIIDDETIKASLKEYFKRAPTREARAADMN